MSTIRTAIELQDNFTGILYSVINSVNLGLSAMEDLHQTMNAPVDTASIDAARNSINQATMAVQQLDAAMQGIEAPETQTPAALQNTAPVVLPVQPDVPDPLVEQPSSVDLPVEPGQLEPVEVPVHWQSDSLEVFTNLGMERFEQEVQSANNMLNTLNQTQSRIAESAAQTDLFPANAVAEMNNMQNRLQAIQQRIQTIESNPLNIGTDMANTELEQLRGQLNQAVQEQENLNRAIDNMDVQAANEAYLRLSQTIGNTERYIRDNVDEQGRFNREIEEGGNEANQLMQTIKGAIAAYATIQTLSAALNLSDQLTSTTARLNLMNDGLQTTQDLQNMIYLSAERARGSYQATADAVSKLGLMAGDAFGSSEEIIAFMEQVNKQFTIAGTEAAGIDAAMLQLTQAMGSGVLRGEEYNSILEQAPNIIQAIADYMEVPKGQLKDMAAEGQITAEIVKAAMFAAADETNTKFESMPKTFSQIWTSFQNTALMAFQPILQRMNEIANSEAFQEFVNNAIETLSMVAGIGLEIFDLLVGVAGVVADNWSWLSPIIYGVAGALMVYYGAMLLYNTITGISAAITAAKALAEKVHAVSLKVDAAATATIGNIRDLRDNLDRVSVRFDETEPEVRENIQSQDTLGTILRKIHKWLADLRGGAFSAVANNCTTAEEGHVLDARQGKILQEGVEEIRVEVTEVNSVVDQLKKSVADGKVLIASAITGKGVSTAADAAFGTMANNIKGISTVPHIGSASGSGSYYVNYDDNQDRRFTGSFNVNLGAVAGKSVVGVYISDTTTTTEPGGYLATYERRTWVSSWNQSTATVSFYFHWNCKFRGTMRCSATLSVIYA